MTGWNAGITRRPVGADFCDTGGYARLICPSYFAGYENRYVRQAALRQTLEIARRPRGGRSTSTATLMHEVISPQSSGTSPGRPQVEACSIPSSDNPRHCWAMYMRSMRSTPIGSRLRPSPLGPTVVLLFLNASQYRDNSDDRLVRFSSRSSAKNHILACLALVAISRCNLKIAACGSKEPWLVN